MRVHTYIPQSVSIPGDITLARDLVTNISYMGTPLDKTDRDNYDSDTVLYDIYWDRELGRVVGIGPPMVNLESHLLPLNCWIKDSRSQWCRASVVIQDSEEEEFEDQFSPAPFVFVINLEGVNICKNTEYLPVKIRFSSTFETTLNVMPNNHFGWKNCTLAALALQKNNPMQWISDWIWYHSALGINNYIIYDNGSQNVDEIIDIMADSSVGGELVVVQWNYKYGPITSFPNEFCQVGCLTHANHYFQKNRWLLNLDLDEYIVPGDMSIIDLLEEHNRLEFTLIQFTSYWIPNTPRKDDSVLPRAFHYPYRDSIARDRAFKYFVKSGYGKILRQHTGEVVGKKTLLDPEELCFFHYIGLTTNWKKAFWNRHAINEVRKDFHCQDNRVVDVIVNAPTVTF